MEIAKRSARGSAILFSGNLLATVILAAASIVVARLLGPSDFGLFSLSLVVPTLLQYLTHFGTRTAVTRYVAHYLTTGEVELARRFAQSAMLFSVVVGAVLAVGSYFASEWTATVLFQRPELGPYIALASLYIFAQAMVLNVIAISVGWNAMGQASFANVLQAGLKLVLSPALVLLGFGVSGAVVGHVLSFVIGGALSAALLFFTKIKFAGHRLGHFLQDTREMMRFGFGPFLATLLTGLGTFYISILVAAVTVGQNELVGYYSIAFNLTVPLTILSTAIALALYPAFTSLQGMKADTGQAFALSLKYSSFLIGPIIFFLIAAAPQLLYAFYGQSYVPASLYLVLFALANLPLLFGQTIFPSFFNGIGRPKLTFAAVGTGAVALFVAAPVFSVVGGLGVDGLIVALLLQDMGTVVVGHYFLSRGRLGAVAWRSLFGTLAASVLALGACLVLPSFGHNIILLGLKILVFGGVYLTLAPAFGGMGVADLDRLQSSVGEVRLVGMLAKPFIGYARGIARRTNRGDERERRER